MSAQDLRDVLNTLDEASHDDESAIMGETAQALASIVRELLEPTNVQALALARLMRDRPGAQVVVHRDVFDLPNGYWLAIIGLDGFQCGIAPDGSVSS